MSTGDSTPPTVALSKLTCKISALENELLRCRSETESATSEAQRLNEENQAMKRKLQAQRAESNEREGHFAHTVSDLQEQVRTLSLEREALSKKLDVRDAELQSLLELRETSQESAKLEAHTLTQQLRKSQEKCEGLVSELSCQQLLVKEIEMELQSLRSQHEAVQTELAAREEGMKRLFETVQSSSIDTEILTQRLEEQNRCLGELKGEVQEMITEKAVLLEERGKERHLSEERQTRIERLKEELRDARAVIEKERKERESQLTLLKSQEEANTKQDTLIEELQQTITDLQQSNYELKNKQHPPVAAAEELNPSQSPGDLGEPSCKSGVDSSPKLFASQATEEAAGAHSTKAEKNLSSLEQASAEAVNEDLISLENPPISHKRRNDGLTAQQSPKQARNDSSMKGDTDSKDEGNQHDDCIDDFFTSL